jgi:antitoxin HicB
MVALQYPVVMTNDDNGTWLVTFPDFGDAVTFGDTRDEALAHAVDALETVIISRMNHKLDFPTPSPGRGKPVVSIPPLTAAKALLYMPLRTLGDGLA